MRTFAIAVALLVGAGAHAADLQTGKTKAAMACAGCHGLVGLAMQPNVPNLAGQSAIYLTEQLKNYRSGKRTHEIMTYIAKPLSDDEIDAVVQWYSTRTVRVEADGS